MKRRCECTALTYALPYPRHDMAHPAGHYCQSIATRHYHTADFDVWLCAACFELRVQLSGEAGEEMEKRAIRAVRRPHAPERQAAGDSRQDCEGRMTDRHPSEIAGALELRIEKLYEAAMDDSTPAIHEHKNRADELLLELQDAITRRELEASLKMVDALREAREGGL